MSLQQIPGLYFGQSNVHGRGVFCINDISVGDFIEIAPVVALPDTSLQMLKESELYNYYFLWGDDVQVPAIVFGYGSLYNHSPNPNAEFELDLENNTVVFKAIRAIASGEEIMTDYHEGQPGVPLWFEVV